MESPASHQLSTPYRGECLSIAMVQHINITPKTALNSKRGALCNAQLALNLQRVNDGKAARFWANQNSGPEQFQALWMCLAHHHGSYAKIFLQHRRPPRLAAKFKAIRRSRGSHALWL